MENKRLAGRVALVIRGGQLTGEDTGNGRAAAQPFGQHGALVAVVDRNLDSAEETAESIIEAGGEAFALRADVTSEADMREQASGAIITIFRTQRSSTTPTPATGCRSRL